MSRYIVHDDDGWAVSNKFRPIGWLLLNHLSDRVTDAEFEVIEPTKEQHGTEQSAGDGIQYDYTGTDRPTAGTGTGISGHTFGTITTT